MTHLSPDAPLLSGSADFDAGTARRLIVTSAAAALATDLTVRSGIVGIAGAWLVAVTAIGFLVVVRPRNRQATAAVAVAACMGAALTIRTGVGSTMLTAAAVAAL